MTAKRVLAAGVVFALLVTAATGSLAAEKAYLANKDTKKYHLVACTWAQKIAQRNRIEFSTVDEAEKAGFVPCNVCRPDRSRPKR